MRYYPLTKEFGPHYDMHDLADFHDNPSDTGGPFENQEEAAPEDTDAEKGFVTIGQFVGGQPGAGGVAWQWCSERVLEGFLYGELDTAGTFTGPDILYIYPDFRWPQIQISRTSIDTMSPLSTPGPVSEAALLTVSPRVSGQSP